MIRTAITVVLLCIATLFLPLPLQLLLYVVAVATIPHRAALFIPAVLSDAFYGTAAIGAVRMTLFVAGLLAAYWFLFYKTRFGEMLHGVET